MQKTKFIFILAVLLTVILGFKKAAVLNIPQNNVSILINESTYLNEMEKEMMMEINLVRSNPSHYVQYAVALLQETRSDSVRLSNMISESIKRRVVYEDYGEVITIDTIRNNYYDSRVEAITELIDELSHLNPMNQLEPNNALYTAAKKHGTKQSVNNYIDHYGLDGTWPIDRLRAEAPWITEGNENIVSGVGKSRDFVLQLLVDSGVANRGHRRNILNSKWTKFACYNVLELNKKDYKWWIQEFAY